MEDTVYAGGGTREGAIGNLWVVVQGVAQHVYAHHGAGIYRCDRPETCPIGRGFPGGGGVYTDLGGDRPRLVAWGWDPTSWDPVEGTYTEVVSASIGLAAGGPCG